MKYAIRALGWATIILWILVIVFSGTVVYSATQLGMNFEGEPEVTALNGMLAMSLPFSVRNGGLYDISELDVTTRIAAEDETVISRSITPVPLVSRGDSVNEIHNFSVSLDDVLARNLTYMLFSDVDLSVDMSVGFTYAYAIPLRISSNLTMPWGAPLSNLTIGEITEVSQSQASAPLSFENHAFFGLNGTIRLEIMDSFNTLIGSGTTEILVPPEYGYDDVIPLTLTGDFAEKAEAHIYFETSVFSYGPVVIPID